MIKVSIIGSGNVAQHLITTFQNLEKSINKIELVQAFARKKESLSHLLPQEKITDDLNTLAEADLYIISISDDAIATVSDALPFKNRLVVHTSGSTPFTILNDNNRKGVFYPLQTFTKGKPVDFKTIPLCLEAENPSDYQILDKVAKAISDKVYAINSEQRKALHVAAVFVNNFTNHLYSIGNDICLENQIPFDILKPLMEETLQKLQSLSPKEAQTGPAIRQDQKTIAAHEAFLKNENQLKIYKTLTQSIQENGKKL
ncbi:NADP oxidoreductase coenzyme F420-dependent [Flavobacterium glycines]|uniref:NADP oxidoreductase coenzyme F420-dependent n=1 Tax=Flavobacterium glycines TaxID=551990 RepID=A0A1B9DGM9_9FLAO|nr:DUF2520 domain-containing protein [Flavobacterium glycines]OCB68864.1 hypothetical protein FBGL_14880 [Flavobacterium glycines]GEL11049.1 hypothetical protein FGL01_17880 [Flavobacterium glycines]SDJ30817.1 NADP oxidoreductase coenzyme F420-dependent [Flavobacterium glycines]